MWNLTEGNDETGRHKDIIFHVNDSEPYNVNFVFLGTTSAENDAPESDVVSIQSEEATQALVSSNTTEKASGIDDPHLTTFFGEKYNM